MINQNEQFPKIRFHNYCDEWKQQKLGEAFEQTVEYVDPCEQNLELWSVTVESGLTPKEERYNREFLVKKSDKFKKLYPEEIVYNPMNITIGAVGFNNAGKEVAVSGYYVTMKMKSQFSNKFFSAWLSCPKAIRLYKIYSTGSLIERQRVQFPTLSDIRDYFPTFEEQTAIGSLFSTLDDLLESYKYNLIKYQSFKVTMLSKMFPKAGQTVPEIRLDGFEDRWEEKEFIQIVNRVTESSDSDSLPKVEFEDIISGQGKLNKDISSKFDNRKGILFKSGYTLYGKLRPYLNNWLLPKFEGVALGDFWVFDPNGNNSDFIYYLVQSSRYQKVANDTSGTKMPRSDWKSVSTTIFAIPQTIAEQQAIGSYFSNLDNLINSYQEKISQLETLKKKLLQDMFI